MSRRLLAFFLISPVVIGLALLVMPLFFGEEELLKPLAFLWLLQAAPSALLAELMRRRTLARYRDAKDDYPTSHPTRFWAQVLYAMAIMIEVVHILFVTTGVSAAFFPEDSPLRRVLARDFIMLGQYILFEMILLTYVADTALRRLAQERHGHREASERSSEGSPEDEKLLG